MRGFADGVSSGRSRGFVRAVKGMSQLLAIDSNRLRWTETRRSVRAALFRRELRAGAMTAKLEPAYKEIG
jgi:hypothetical protein